LAVSLTGDPAPFTAGFQRVATARSALSAAMWTRGDHPTIADEAVVDLLADLRHFCVARHIDFAACNRIAQAHFETEFNGGQR
jgi:hypothetical protein